MNSGFRPRSNGCKNRDGAVIEDGQEVMDRWAEHFGQLLSGEPQGNAEDDPPEESNAVGNQELISPPTIDEVKESVGRLKNNKAPGEDQLVAEFFKHGGERLHNELHTLVLRIWDSECMPDEWCSSVICPIFKKGDKLRCENYRGISLLAVAYKIFSNILVKRLNIYAERLLGDYQGGFRRGRGTADQIFVMRQTMEKCWEFNIGLHLLFIDFRQAFDRVSRSRLLAALKEQRIPEKLIRLIDMTLTGSCAKVLVNGEMSREFPVSSGVRQGDALSTTLFNLALHYVIEKMNVQGNIVSKSKQVCAYADDICLVARNMQSLEEMFHQIKSKGEEMGLKINVDKTKYMQMSRQGEHESTQDLKLDDCVFQRVQAFPYLGVDLNDKARMMDEIEKRIMAGNRAYYANLKLLRSTLLSRTTKVRLYRTLIRPIVTYGAETWVISTVAANKLRVFERKILRKIFGAVCVGGEWRVRTNDELQHLYHQEDIVQFIKARRIDWLGHVERMPTRMPNSILHARMMGTRRMGRPRTRWLQDVEGDLKKLGIRNWKRRAQDRSEWRTTVRQAKAHPGL